jgi:hypothetical protein
LCTIRNSEIIDDTAISIDKIKIEATQIILINKIRLYQVPLIRTRAAIGVIISRLACCGRTPSDGSRRRVYQRDNLRREPPIKAEALMA